MTAVDVTKDAEAGTLALSATYPAPPERVWAVWTDPRQTERWWGPPGYPATFTALDATVGGHATYFMTSPEGERHHGWWTIVAVAAPHTLEFDDGFGEQPGVTPDGMPVTRVRVTLEAVPDGTLMTVHSTFPTPEAMAQLLAMGMAEGMTMAMGQIPALLAAPVGA